MDRQARDWAMGCHLAALVGWVVFPLGWIIGPLIVWLMRREDFAFVDYHGKESLNFHISVLIYIIIFGILSFLFIGIPFLLITLVGQVVFSVRAGIKASHGEYYRYPLTIRFIK